MLKKALIMFFMGFGVIAPLSSMQSTGSASPLYPMGDANQTGYLQVSEKHHLYYATYGNPKGIPVVVLHGGPGLGCKNSYMRFFDPDQWYIVMFDQRGALRSKPLGCMEDNTPQHSIEDMEKLREKLQINQWVVFGGSWGSCLSLLYGQAHPESCLGFILNGIFLGRDEDIRFFKDIEKFSLEAYQAFIGSIPSGERNCLPEACYRRIMDPSPEVHMAMARALLRYIIIKDNPSITPSDVEKLLENETSILSFARAFLHYAVNQCFLEPNQVLSHMNHISHLPAILIHGSLDTVCSLEQAQLLHKEWPQSNLWIVEGGSHSSGDPLIASELVKATNAFLLIPR